MRKMKNSGIEWIGEIPENWGVINFGNVLKEHKIPNLNLNTNVLQFKYGKIIKKKKFEISSEFEEILLKYNVVSPKVIIINGLNLAFDFITQRIAIVEEFGVITSTYIAVDVVPEYDAHYVNYLLKAFDFQKVFHGWGRGLRCMLSYEILKNEKLLYSSKNEQQKIADYLDKRCENIDGLVELQNRIIEKLKEYKQSVITEAVTKGLDPAAKMKNSGVEWIGEIPENWEVNSTKRIFKIISGATPKSDNPEYWEGDIKWITPADYKTEQIYIYNTNRNITQKGLESCSSVLIPENSIIFSKRAPIGLVAINKVKLCTNQGCLSCVNINDFNIKYFYYVMAINTKQYELLGTGTTFKEISLSAFSNYNLPCPPIDEQQKIADYLDAKCAEIDRLIEIKQKKIEKLQDYKKSLIYECVTGKREVS